MPSSLQISPCDHMGIRKVAQALEWLFQKNVLRVQRPYHQKTASGRWVWSGYSAEAWRHKVSTLLNSLLTEYTALIEANHLTSLERPPFLEKMVYVYSGNPRAWADSGDKPDVMLHLIRDEAAAWPQVSFMDTGLPSEIRIEGDGRLFRSGVEIPVYQRFPVSTSVLWEKLPMQQMCYALIGQGISRELGQRIDAPRVLGW